LGGGEGWKGHVHAEIFRAARPSAADVLKDLTRGLGAGD
jgi:hypothetical protein